MYVPVNIDMGEAMPEGFVTMKEAQELLGVSNQKMWRLVRDGVLEAIKSPLDQRVKLIARSRPGLPDPVRSREDTAIVSCWRLLVR
jgi:predicted DNA-binding transcriptional regulator AlpA